MGVKKIKKYYLPTPLPLFDWDIENYSASVKYLLKKKMINRHLRKHQRQQVHLLQILNSMQAWEKLQKRELKWEFLHLRHIKRPL